jgi:hypothetical protein
MADGAAVGQWGLGSVAMGTSVGSVRRTGSGRSHPPSAFRTIEVKEEQPGVLRRVLRVVFWWFREVFT